MRSHLPLFHSRRTSSDVAMPNLILFYSLQLPLQVRMLPVITTPMTFSRALRFRGPKALGTGPSGREGVLVPQIKQRSWPTSASKVLEAYAHRPTQVWTRSLLNFHQVLPPISPPNSSRSPQRLQFRSKSHAWLAPVYPPLTALPSSIYTITIATGKSTSRLLLIPLSFPTTYRQYLAPSFVAVPLIPSGMIPRQRWTA